MDDNDRDVDAVFLDALGAIMLAALEQIGDDPRGEVPILPRTACGGTGGEGRGQLMGIG